MRPSPFQSDFAIGDLQALCLPIAGNALLYPVEDIGREKPPGEGIWLVACNGLQIIAWPYEAIELCRDNPGRLIIQPEVTLQLSGDFNGIFVIRWLRVGDRHDVDKWIAILIRGCDHDGAWPCFASFGFPRHSLRCPEIGIRN